MEGARSRYKLIMSLKFTTPTIQKYKNPGWTLALQIPRNLISHKAYTTKIQNCQSGPSRYKLKATL